MKPFQRRRIVTDEPQRIAPELMGWPLATPWRRGAAFLTDLALFGLLYVVVLISVTSAVIQRTQPEFLPAMRGYVSADGDSARTAAGVRWRRAVVEFVAARKPSALPDSVRAGLERGDRGALERYVAAMDDAATLGIQTHDGPEPLYDPDGRRLILKPGMFMGSWGRLLGGLSAMVVYFTLLTRLMGGRTPGKALWRIRVVRLDGRPLRLWDAFDRAGGYGASFSTACLGFLEAFWHPNRQTVHDRIAGTVVIRTRKGGRDGSGSRSGPPDDDVRGPSDEPRERDGTAAPRPRNPAPQRKDTR